MPHIHTLLHVDFEDLGCIADWAKDRGHKVSSTRFYQDDWHLPSLENFDWLIIMGGPMSASDDSKYPWLAAEKAFIKQAITAGKTVLGICLGAQLIAHALGARIRKNPQKEIGWLPIQLTEEGMAHPVFAGLPSTLSPVFHWHGDTFTIPKGASNIAYSQACDNQGFIYDVLDGKVVGLQFHFEATQDSLNNMVKEGKAEIEKAVQTTPFVQPADEILALANEHIKQNNTWMHKLLDNLCKQSH